MSGQTLFPSTFGLKYSSSWLSSPSLLSCTSLDKVADVDVDVPQTSWMRFVHCLKDSVNFDLVSMPSSSRATIKMSSEAEMKIHRKRNQNRENTILHFIILWRQLFCKNIQLHFMIQNTLSIHLNLAHVCYI